MNEFEEKNSALPEEERDAQEKAPFEETQPRRLRARRTLAPTEGSMPGESKAAAEARDTGDETAAPDGGASLPEQEGGVGAAPPAKKRTAL